MGNKMAKELKSIRDIDQWFQNNQKLWWDNEGEKDSDPETESWGSFERWPGR